MIESSSALTAARGSARLVGVLLLACLALVQPLACAAASGPASPRALILYDSASSYGWLGELHALQVANLLGHFPVEWTIEPVEGYVAGEVADYSVMFYLGTVFDNPLPPAFLSDVMTTDRVVCWFEHNLWQIAWNEARFWDPAFTARYGFQFAGVDESGFPEVQYKGESLLKDPLDPAIGATIVFDEGLAEVKAVAHRPATDTQPEASWPYVVHAGNLWYFADSPFTYVSEEDRYLVFCDLIHDIVGIDHAPSHRALIRIEDVDPTVVPKDLTDIATYLKSQSAPFEVSVIPVFNDPLGVLNGGVAWQVKLSDASPVVRALERMVSDGGRIILHGYTHQYDATPNPYNGLTSDDCEFFISTWSDESGKTDLVGPVPEDSVEWVNGRIDAGLAELSANGFTPVAWETPHYASSALDAVEFGRRFDLVSGRQLYFGSFEQYFAGQFYPYVIERDIYGQKVLPENLGNVEPEPFYDYPARFPVDIVRAAQKNLVIRDGWASAYFHPGLDLGYLADIVQGVKALGYAYVAPPTVVASAGPDKTIFYGESVKLEGSASKGSAPYSYSWWPTAGLSDPSVVQPMASPDSTTTYTLTVVDHSGGMDTDTVTVTVIPPVVAEAGPDRMMVVGDSCVLDGSASGGAPPYSYSWSPTDGLDDPSVAQPTASPETTTTYTLSVTDDVGQVDSDGVTVTMHSEAHRLTVSASATPDTVDSEGSAGLSATAEDNWGHGVTFAWSDGGAGGSFLPSAYVQDPTYTAPPNRMDTDRTIYLTVIATCDWSDPLSGTDSTTLIVRPVAHSLLVGAAAVPSTIASGGSVSLSGTATDSRVGHTIVSWSWSDGGAGGVFSPSASVQNPTYVAPVNATDSDRIIGVTVTATCSGSTPLTASGSTDITVKSVPHSFSVAVAPPQPAAVVSGGRAGLSAAASDSRGHAVASWSWSDGGAGGAFSPSASAQNPTYTAPANTTDSERTVTLTASATCDGASPLSDSDSTTLTVQPVAHVITVAVAANPTTVASGASAALSATAADSRDGHTIVSWSWSDGGAGGAFSPSASVRNPTYTAPANTTDDAKVISLAVTATCGGPTPASGSGSAALSVQPVAHTFSVVVALPEPSVVASAGSASLSATFNESRSHGVASWSWSDAGAGGAFSPSASVQHPTYTAPANTTDDDRTVSLTVSGTCDGPEPLSAGDSTTLTVHPVEHSLTVSVSASPGAVVYGDSADLSAAATDSRTAHVIASWSWSDGGMGGAFLPSAEVQNPAYATAASSSESESVITLTATATCDGLTPISSSGSTTLTVGPAAHAISVTASAAPNAIGSGATTDLSASATDSRGHAIAAWSWSDGGAGGSFLPSPELQAPQYTAPVNLTGAGLNVVLTVTATCGASDPVSGTASTTLTVASVPAGSSEVSGQSLPDDLQWDEVADLSVTYRNLDSYSWMPDEGYRLVAEDWEDRWGGVTVPLEAEVAPGDAYTFDFSIAAPPLTTLRYEQPVAATAPGVPDSLSCAWQFARGAVLWDGSPVFRDVAISRFADIQPSLGHDASWARFHIEELAGRVPVVVKGFDDGTYRPGTEVARDAMAVYIFRALKLATAPYSARFADIGEDFWAWPDIEGLAEAGIVQGYDDGTYRPTLIVNRDAMAVYIARALVGGMNIPDPPPDPTFTDVPADDWSHREIEYCVAQGVVKGFEDDTYRPATPVTRGQMAVYLWRAFVMPVGSPVVLGGPAVTAVDPDAVTYHGWSTRSTGSSSQPSYAYVILDAVRLGTDLAEGDGSFDVLFELRGPVAYSQAVSLTTGDISAARDSAVSSGIPYYAVSWRIPAQVEPGTYALVVSVEHQEGVFQELARQPEFVVTP